MIDRNFLIGFGTGVTFTIMTTISGLYFLKRRYRKKDIKGCSAINESV